MRGKRHQRDTKTFRQLTYQERVKSFNATVRLLTEYTRVMIEENVTARRAATEIKRKRLTTIQKGMDAIERL